MEDRPLNPTLEAEVVALLHVGKNMEALKKIVEGAGCSVGEAHGWMFRYFRENAPCPYCGKPLPTISAKQCFECGTDWHDPNHVVRRGAADTED